MTTNVTVKSSSIYIMTTNVTVKGSSI